MLVNKKNKKNSFLLYLLTKKKNFFNVQKNEKQVRRSPKKEVLCLIFKRNHRKIYLLCFKHFSYDPISIVIHSIFVRNIFSSAFFHTKAFSTLKHIFRPLFRRFRTTFRIIFPPKKGKELFLIKARFCNFFFLFSSNRKMKKTNFPL